jgi:hypothetical protein
MGPLDSNVQSPAAENQRHSDAIQRQGVGTLGVVPREIEMLAVCSSVTAVHFANLFFSHHLRQYIRL